MTMRVFAVIDALNTFGIITDIVTLGNDYRRTKALEDIRFGAVLSQEGYLTLKAQSELIKMIINIICNPGSPHEAKKINSDLKCLSSI